MQDQNEGFTEAMEALEAGFPGEKEEAVESEKEDVEGEEQPEAEETDVEEAQPPSGEEVSDEPFQPEPKASRWNDQEVEQLYAAYPQAVQRMHAATQEAAALRRELDAIKAQVAQQQPFNRLSPEQAAQLEAMADQAGVSAETLHYLQQQMQAQVQQQLAPIQREAAYAQVRESVRNIPGIEAIRDSVVQELPTYSPLYDALDRTLPPEQLPGAIAQLTELLAYKAHALKLQAELPMLRQLQKAALEEEKSQRQALKSASRNEAPRAKQSPGEQAPLSPADEIMRYAERNRGWPF